MGYCKQTFKTAVHRAANSLVRADRRQNFMVREELLNVAGEAQEEITQLKQRITELEQRAIEDSMLIEDLNHQIEGFKQALNKES